MVRNITGTLVAIGSGDEDVSWAEAVLSGRDRTRAGMAAPPHGLTLVQVFYPDGFGIPAPSELGQ
jgi:tRNA pseudouridine38-40 synthase